MVHHQLPLKIMVLNNQGYLSIRSTQRNFFGRLMGESTSNGVSFPDMVKIGEAYGIQSVRVDTTESARHLPALLNQPGPLLVDVRLDPLQEFEPRVRSKQLADGKIVSPPLEDMFPFLDAEELAGNSIPEDHDA